MTPVWVFPAYPLLLTAPFGANLIWAANSTGQLTTINAIAVATASVTVQGTGFLISFMICAAFLYRLMTQKLPRDAQRPGVFISIGPSGFTAAGIGNIFPLPLPLSPITTTNP
jgi:tellurite resistance protein TehA-like permease